MDLPVTSWYEAIFFRKSRRSFMPDRPLADDQYERLENLSRHFRPFDDARVLIIREPPERVLRGVLGSYGRVSGAPAYAVMVGNAASARTEAHVGYTGEALILEATSLGLGTCWVSGMFRKSEAGKRVALSGDERIYAVTPLGLGKRDFSVKEKIFAGVTGSRNRKSLDAITEGTPSLPWQRKALEAARLAPSARNSQPWRFLLTTDSITIRRDSEQDGGRYPQNLDCGIAMLHLELGARAGGAAGCWTELEAPAVARFDTTGASNSFSEK